jgi:hypothetical protein
MPRYPTHRRRSSGAPLTPAGTILVLIVLVMLGCLLVAGLIEAGFWLETIIP